MKLSDFVINFFEKKKIKQVFHISGGGCMHLTDSLNKSKLDKLFTHHEQAALMAAEGYTRQTNKPALSIVTTGPGGTNCITGLLGLWLDSIPSIIISGQVPKNQLSVGTGCRQIGDQEFDIVNLVKPITKYSKIINDKNDILYELEKAFDIATSNRPGPVWIDIPLDIQSSKINLRNLKRYSKKNKSLKGESKIKMIYSMIKSSKKPLFIIGNGIRLSDSYDVFNLLLKKTQIPVVTGPHSGVDSVDNTYRYYAGRIGILGQITSNQILQDSDLIICLGTRLNIKMTGYNLKEFSPNSKKIIIDIDMNEMNKHSFKIDLKCNLDLKQSLQSLLKYNYNLEINGWRNKVLDLRKNQIYAYPKHINLKKYTSLYYFISRCPKFIKKTPIITSNGSAHVVALQTYQLKKNQRLYTNVGCASMGFGLPAAIGACIGNNKKEVVCIEGDGSIMMNLQEFETIRGNNLPIKIILINNEGYLSIKLTQESFFKGNEVAAGPSSGVTIPNFKKLCKVFDFNYVSILNNSQIDFGLEKFMKYKGPTILEVFCHPKEKHEPKVAAKGLDKYGNIIPGTLTDMKITSTI